MAEAGGVIGRGPELGQLLGLIERTERGDGGTIVLVGDPGVGKSALLAELKARVSSRARCLAVLGVASEASLPFSGLHQLAFPVRDLIARLPSAQGRAVRGAMGLDEVGSTDPYLVALGTLSLLSEAAVDQPLLLVVDDAPWLDAASRDAILFACRRLTGEHIAAVLASRSDDWDALGQTGLPTLRLEGLDDESAASLIAERTGVAPHDDVRRRLVEATGRNPLGLIEATSGLSPDQLNGRAPLPPRLPMTAGLERAFAARVADLAKPLQTLLLVAAADETGRRDVLGRAAEMLRVPEAVFEEAIRERFLVEDGGALAYRHPLIRSAVYGRAAAAERRAVHHALAEALATSDPDRSLWHLVAATDRPDPALADRLDDLARRARARGALDEAVRAWDRGAALTGSPALAATLLLRAAAAARVGGQLPRARDLLRRADEQHLAGSQLTEALSVRGGIELAAGDAVQAYRLLVEAAASCETTDPERALRILNVAAEAASLSGERSASARLAAVVARIPELPGPLGASLRSALLGFAADFAGDLAVAVPWLRIAVDLAADIADPAVKLVGGRAAVYIGDDLAARALHLAVVEDARERAAVDLLPIAAPRLALAEALLGRWASAAATAAETTRIADDTGQILLAPHGRICLGLLDAMRGDQAAMHRHLDDALAAVTGRPIGLLEDDAAWVRGVEALGRQQADEALAHLGRVEHPVVEALSGLDRIEAAAACEDPRAVVWVDHAERLALYTGAPWAEARAAYGRALLATQPAEALAQFDHALAVAAASTRPFERARIQLAAGAFLRRQRRRVDARAQLRAAVTGFDILGAVPWAERARAELRATGETAAPRERMATESLTPQELQVARAVAQGYSNADVAARLFLSRRTIEFHLRNVFSKLGISSRTQLARLVLDQESALEESRAQRA